MKAIFVKQGDERIGEIVDVLWEDTAKNTFCISFWDDTAEDVLKEDILMADKNIEGMSREELLDEAVMLLRVVNTYESEEKQREYFEKLPDEELAEYVASTYKEGFLRLTDEDREQMWKREVEWELRERECRSATARDYGPSNPWDAPGMSVKDFI